MINGYCIINKIELINGSVIYTPVYYTTNATLCSSINADYDSTLGDWIETNKTDLENNVVSISTFFNTTPIVYVAKTETTSVVELGLTEINNINELI